MHLAFKKAKSTVEQQYTGGSQQGQKHKKENKMKGQVGTFPEDSAQLLFQAGCQIAIIAGCWE